MSARQHTVKHVVLKNGSEGLLIDVPNATVMAMLFNFRAGQYLMDDLKWETPHIMEHMAFGANSKFDKARSFQAEYGKNGSYWNASTDDYHVTYETECADFEWERVLSLMLLSFSEPIFLEEEFVAECGNVRDELISRSNNRGAILSIALSQAAGFRAHQFSERVDLMKHVELDDIIAHHAKTHTTRNLRFILAGNMKERTEKIEQMIENLPLPRGAQLFELPQETTKMIPAPIYIAKEEVPNVFFEAVGYAPGIFNDNHWTAAGMMTNILTGTLYSRILGEARERGLVYGLGSNFTRTKDEVGWWLSGQAQAENLPEIARITTREIRRVLDGEIDASDIEAARQFMLGSFQRGAQTVMGVARGYSGRYFFENAIEDYYGIPMRAKRTKRTDIVDMARRVFPGAKWGFGILGTAPERLHEEVAAILKPIWQK